MTEGLSSGGQEYKVTPIPSTPEAQAKRGWSLAINGAPVKDPVEIFRLSHSKMGVEVIYGQRAEGFDGPVIKEPGGGGSVTIPYLIRDGQLYIGVIEEKRPTCTDGQPAPVLNVPRGFLDPGTTHFATAVKELREETGFKPLEQRVQELDGEPMNPNSTFFVTGKGKGVKMYGVQVQNAEVYEAGRWKNPEEREFKFRNDVIQPTSKMGERIAGSKFIHWKQAVQQIDMFTAAGVARLMPTQQEQADKQETVTSRWPRLKKIFSRIRRK